VKLEMFYRIRGIPRKILPPIICALFCLTAGCSSNPAGAKAFPAFPAAEQITTAATYAYPLKVSEDRRYLVDQNNKPFRIQGDSAQSLIANLTYAEAQLYFSDRQAKGFNTININLLEHKCAHHYARWRKLW
jgi:hypothetical protein